MSKIALSPDANGAGIFTIASPNSGTNRTLTLPDETGTLTSTASTPTFTGAVTAPAFIPNGASPPTNGEFLPAANTLAWATNSTERVRVDANGNFLVGTATVTGGVVFKSPNSTAAIEVWTNASSANPAYWTGGSGSVNGVATGSNAAATLFRINKDSGSTRSINAAGSVNANGADYAEYMTKAGDFVIAKGDICGIDVNGNLTNVFSDAISFVVKSTNPSYVGGDNWGVASIIGKEPDHTSTQEEIDAFKAKLEKARQKVDRIAFSGQVPVNVLGATPGQYIIPIDYNGAIKGQAISNPTFEQYQLAVGKVIAIEEDGRARIIVKVV